jgi:hypothetical protein
MCYEQIYFLNKKERKKNDHFTFSLKKPSKTPAIPNPQSTIANLAN